MLFLKDMAASKGTVGYTDLPSAALAKVQFPQAWLQMFIPINPLSTSRLRQSEFIQHKLFVCSDLGIKLS